MEPHIKTVRLSGVKHGQVRVWLQGQWWNIVYGPSDVKTLFGERTGVYVIQRLPSTIHTPKIKG